MLDIKSSLTSASSLLEMALSLSVDCELTLRSFNHGAFSSNPDAALPVKAIVGSENLRQWPLFICGDFNGDGRPDFVVQRSLTQWNIFCSTDAPSPQNWFSPQPTISFETPMRGWLEVQELNGDGRSDLILRNWDDPRIVLFLSQSTPAKGGRP